MRRQVRAEHIGHENEFVFTTDGTNGARFFAEVASRAHEFRMRVAHLVLTQAATTVFVDEVLTSETMVNGTTTTQRTCTETHGPKASDGISPDRNGAQGTLET